MSDPVVHITNGISDTGTGNITTLGAVVAALGTPIQATGGTVGLVAGTNVIGHVIVDTAAVTNAGTFAVQNTTATPAGTNTIGAVENLGHAGGILDFSGQNAAAPASAFLVGGEFNTAPTTITTGNASPLQLDASGNLLVNIKAGAGSGGTAIADEATFTEGTTSVTPIGGVFKTSHWALTTGQAGVVALSAAREMNTLGNVRDGTNTAAVKAASTASVATDPAIVVAVSPNNTI